MQASDAGGDGNGPAPSAASRTASATATPEPGLLLPAGGPGAWDEAGLGHPVVRYYLGDDEQRWFMWYSGRSASCQDVDDVFPSSGSVGAQGPAHRKAALIVCWLISTCKMGRGCP